MRCSVFLSVLLSPVLLAAQTAPADRPDVILFPGTVSSICPVEFSATRTPANLYAIDGKPSPRLGVQLRFGPASSSTVVKALVAVRGFSGKAAVVPLDSGSTPDAAETFELHAPSPDSALLSTRLWTKNMNSISWVDLKRIEYADGSSWQAPADSACRVKLSGYLLVNDTP